MANKWIQGAHLKKGAFTAQAKAHGLDAQHFAHVVLSNPSNYSPTTVKRARLAVTFKKMAK